MNRAKTPKTNTVLTLLSPNFLNVFGWVLITPLYALYASQLGHLHGVNPPLISAAAALSGLLYATHGFLGVLGVMVLAHLFAALLSLGVPASRKA